MELNEAGTEMVSGRPAVPRLRELSLLFAVAAVLFIAVGSWYLLKELAPLLRPLVLAGFLAYVIVPVHRRLSRRVSTRLAGPLLALLAAVAILGMAALVYGNLIALREELPRLIDRAWGLIEGIRGWGRRHLPAWVFELASHAGRTEADTTARLQVIASSLVNTAAGFLAEAVVVGLYLIFLLIEVRHFPKRV
jgi:predicted PurR-regulated permease PerM